MIVFFKKLRTLLTPSRRKKNTRRILKIFTAHPNGLRATDVWKKLESRTDDYKDPNYVPLAEVYGILVALREKGVLYNVSKRIGDTHIDVYWRQR